MGQQLNPDKIISYILDPHIELNDLELEIAQKFTSRAEMKEGRGMILRSIFEKRELDVPDEFLNKLWNQMLLAQFGKKNGVRPEDVLLSGGHHLREQV
ncbi:MAG TPA: hypothetical protein VG982_00220 [Candidatus Paceibacterota bacterium]|jgi:hypothetical protein|nr:hypothetical protein [Candidatus Paceibacterota bacterium]